MLILAVTLFPYDPAFAPAMSGNLGRFGPSPVGHPGDFLANILLFVPWGFCISGMLAARRRPLHRTLLVLGLGVVLSGSVELTQMGLVSRNPAFADILANLLGVFAGVQLEISRGERWRTRWSSFEIRFKNVLTFRLLGVLLAIHLGLVFGLFRFANHQASLADWDPAFHLNLGNESTGDRPWMGNLGKVRLWRGILPGEVIDRLQAGTVPISGSEEDLLWVFEPSQPKGAGGQGMYFPDFVWRPAPPLKRIPDMLPLSPDHWLTSSGPGARLSDALQQAGQFTLAVEAQTRDVRQTGPGRVVSLSSDPFNRNFTLGQQGPDLVFRLRTPFTGPNGDNPALIVPGVFSEVKKRNLVVTYDGAALVVYPGAGEPPVRLVLKYAGVFRGLGFGYNAADQTGYKAVFWGFVGMPLLSLAAAMFFRIRGGSRAAGR